jgi:hypothetical protein
VEKFFVPFLCTLSWSPFCKLTSFFYIFLGSLTYIFLLFNQLSGLDSGYLGDGEYSGDSEDGESLDGVLDSPDHVSCSFADDGQAQEPLVSDLAVYNLTLFPT